jgi:hypothetical protein
MNNSNSSMTITDSLAKLRSSRELPRSERNAIRSPMSVERVKEVKKHITVLQSLRAGSFEDVTVLGSQYRDHTGASSWYVAVWSEGNIRVRIYRVSGGGATRSRRLGRPRGFAGNHPSMGTFASIATKLKTLCLRKRALTDRQRSVSTGLSCGPIRR